MLTAREIVLADGGGVVLVDADAYEWLNRWRWRLNTKGYASRRTRAFGRPVTVFMHRLILDPPDGLQTDHINRQKLDNRRENLRAVTRSENQCNRAPSSRNSAGRPGVRYEASRGKWRAEIRRDNRSRFLGRFASLQEAVVARRSAE